MPPMSPEKPALCAGCGGKISDRYYLLAVDKQWHLRCLKCCECKLALESELTCFAKDGSIYCKEDYYRYSNLSPWVQKHTPSQGITNETLFSPHGLSKVVFRSQRFLNPANGSPPKSLTRLKTEGMEKGTRRLNVCGGTQAKEKTSCLPLLCGFPA